MNSQIRNGRAGGLQALAFLFGSASVAVLAAADAIAAAAPAPAPAPVEEILITGSLIRGAPPVGVPVTVLGDEDFKEGGALTLSDMLYKLPAIQTPFLTNVSTNNGNNIERGQSVRIHGFSNSNAPETLMLIDGLRYPPQGHNLCFVDPTVIPQLAVDHIDVLADGASATYGSDAVAGVINVMLKHGYDGAISQARYSRSTDIGGSNIQLAQLYGRVWDSGSVTLSYEWYHEAAIQGPARDYFTLNFEPYGFDDRSSIANAMPGVFSTGGLATDPAMAAQGFSANSGTRACTNCFSIPAGTGWNYGDTPGHTNPTAPGSTPTTSWTTLLANKGVAPLRNPASDTTIFATIEHNSATLAFEQTIADDLFGVMRNVSLFVDGFYSNRVQSSMMLPGSSPAAEQLIRAMTVPTTNPYYPVGAPAGLRISYSLGVEHDTHTTGGNLGQRYAFGLTADLPHNWQGKIYYSMTRDQNFTHATGMVNVAMVSAALGNTVASVAANGTIPGQAAFTKPANVPFLNMFCDATEFDCNAKATMDYISAYRFYDEHWNLAQQGIDLDGDVIDLPGGTLRAAVGFSNVSNHFIFEEHSNFSTSNSAIVVVAPNPQARATWATFAQVNVPLVGEMNRLPLIEALNVELAYRYDDYPDFGGVKTPKAGVTWDVGYGLSLRGTYGKSFRAPSFNETSGVGGVTLQPVNTAAGDLSNSFSLDCPAVPGLASAGVANPGTLQAYLNPTCSTATTLRNPGGVAVNGGSVGGAAYRVSTVLNPQKGTNYAVGFGFTPPGILSGLDLQATWYYLKVDGLIASNRNGGININDPLTKICSVPTINCSYIVRANPNLPITDPANALFFQMASAVVLNPRSVVPAGNLANIQFINDTTVTNIGWRQISGIDFSARYDIDFGDWGAWNVGADGNFQLKDKNQSVPGGPVTDSYVGNAGGRLRYRTRLGWTDGAFSVAGFVNMIPHNNQGGTPPPACFWSAANNPASGAPYKAGDCYAGSPFWGPYTVFPGLHYSDLYTVDATIGYKTGTTLANSYLHNLNFQLTVNNLLNKRPPFNYSFGSGRGTAAYVNAIDPRQRHVSFVIMKVW